MLPEHEFRERFSELLRKNSLAGELKLGETTLEKKIEDLENKLYDNLKVHKIKPRDLVRIFRNKMPVLTDKEISDFEEVVEIISEIKYGNKENYFKKLFKEKCDIDFYKGCMYGINAISCGCLGGIIYSSIVAGVGAGLLFSPTLIPGMLLSAIGIGRDFKRI